MLMFPAAHAQEGFTLLSSSNLERVYEWQAPEWKWQSIIIEGRSFLRPDSTITLLYSRPGEPLLPMSAIHFDLLPGQKAVVTLTDTLFSTDLLPLPLCPAPSLDPSTGNVVYRYDPEADGSPEYIPAVSWQSTIGQARDQRILQISLFPLQYRAQERALRSLRYARIRVSLTMTDVALSRPLTTARQRDVPQSAAKFYIVEEGPYAVTGAALEAAGISIRTIDPLSLRLIHKGKPQPLVVEEGGDGRFDADDRILFYGRFRHGESEWFDAYSDTNVYWLAWEGEPGISFTSNAESSTGRVIDAFTDTLHFEKDLYYYAGDSDNDIHNTEKVSGEGWAWVLLNKGGTATLDFTLPAPAAGQDSLSLKMRLRGTTLDSHTPDHHVQLNLNGKKFHEAWFNDRSELYIDSRVPYAFFRPGANTIQILLLADTPSERSQVYLDWFEIGYSRQAVAAEDWLKLKIGPGQEQSVFVSGYADSILTAWDLDKHRRYNMRAAGRMWREYLTVRSAGLVDGAIAKLVRGGVEAASGFRGHNLWRIDPVNGRLMESKNFDTYRSRAQADSMALYIQSLPEGALVAAAISDDGSLSMTEAAHSALESIGSVKTRSVSYRDSWAIIGRKGAPPGSVPEAFSKSSTGPAEADTLIVFREGGSSISSWLDLPADAGAEVAVFSQRGLKTPVRITLYKEDDLFSGGGGADYIIITHPAFKAQADRLAAYRAAQNGWRTRVVLMENIYDAFNHGLANPAAIRIFLSHTRGNWPKPAPEFVLLFGDASWDPKNHYGLDYASEFVPTYGNPVSDSWFACLDGAGDILPDMKIGRIPVRNSQSAGAIVDKIIAYEATPSARWKKDFLFISGGFDFVEQNQFGQQTANLINYYVVKPPTYGHAVALNKTGNSMQEGEHRQEILDTINDGVAWVNFIGHAGSRTWDLMFHSIDIDALANGPRFPFITSMTCHTGRFAEPNQVAFGENFLMVEDKGAIGFMGTSGWGYSYEDYTFLNKLFPAVLKDTLRYLSEIIDVAKVRLWSEASTNPQIRDMIYQYNLLGDPAVKLAIPDRPDLALQPADITVVPEMPSEADSTAQVRLHIHNYGLGSRDSVTVRLLVRHPNLGEQVIASRLRLPPVGRLDSLQALWPLRTMAGAVELIAQVDPDNRIAEADESNNAAQRSITVLSRRLYVVSPPPFALIPAGELILRVQEMDVPKPGKRFIEFAVDTSLSFSSPLFQQSGRLAVDGFTAFWKPSVLPPGGDYYWRCRDLTDPESFQEASGRFSIDRAARWGWRQGGHFDASAVQHIAFSAGAVLDTLHMEMLAVSGGLHDGNFAGIYLNGENVITSGRGYSVVVIDPVTGRISGSRNFDLYGNAPAMGRMAAFLDSVETGYYVITAVKDDGSFDNPGLMAAFESIGSKACRDLGFRDSWALIGVKGSAPGTARELLKKSRTGDVAVQDTLRYLAPSGRLISPRIGPAAAWHSFMAEADVPQTCALTFTLIGQRRNSTQWDTLRTGLPANFDVDLSAISAQAYPWLQLKADFSSSNQRDTPRLYAWQVLHAPVPDLAVTPAHLSLSADAVLSGQPVVLEVDIFNIGLAAADSVRVTFTETAPGSSEKLFSTVLLPKSLAADQSLSLDQLYIPSGKPGSRLVTIRIDGDNRINELSESNNTLTARVQVVADTLHPEIEITVDGRTLVLGDWVAARPLILARLIDDSPLDISDTLRVNLLLDGERVAFGTGQHLRLLASTDSGTVALLQFTPHFDDGEHTLEVIFIDASGNLSSRSIDFAVASRVKLLRVMNYPNPMAQKTDFTFELTQPAEVRIRIYTVNGRLIRALEAGALGAGFNSVFWDGLDGDGDLIANGVYLYRVDAVSGEEHVQVIEKCIVMR